MIWFAAGTLVLFALLWALGRVTQGDPRRMVDFARRRGKQIAGAGVLAVSAFLGLRGNWMATAVLAPIGLGMLKVGPWAGGPWAQNTAKAAGQRSTVRSAFLEMTLDHDTGDMAGVVVSGRYAGHGLHELDEAALRALRTEVAGDPDSAGLFEAYLDRRFPGRREDVEDDPRAGQRGPGVAQAMSEEEAYEILGLQPGAGEDAIRAAHRSLMKRLHPDQGGSTWLAAKLNQAKDVLLDRHR